MRTIKQTKEYIKQHLSKDVYKRLRPLVSSRTYRRKDGCEVAIHLPAFINLVVDEKFSIQENQITFSISNKKVIVTVWKDKAVSAQVTVY